MKTPLRIVLWMTLMRALLTHAQSVTPICFFNGTNGANPYSALALGPEGCFYGTTEGGGSYGYGTVFEVTTNGTLTTLVNFNGTNGAVPRASLTLGPDGNLYGTTTGGGSYGMINGGYGTVFKVTTDGTLTTLVNFNGIDESNPFAGLTPGPDGNFYGATAGGGISNCGTVFRVTPSGTLTTLVNFSYTNGANPFASLTPGPDGNFYGTTHSGGSDGLGTVFQVTTNGTLTTLANFNGTNGAGSNASLTPGPDGSFYGTSTGGGDSGLGIVFKVTTNGALTTMASFNGINGAHPIGGLILGPDHNFYGTSQGVPVYGTVFKMTTRGRLTALVAFNYTNGARPRASLVLGPDSNFYGTTYLGGSGGRGTIFRLNLPPDWIASPTDQYAAIGGSAIFQCQLFGTGPFAYQWLSNGVPIVGATGSSLTVANFSLDTATNAQFQVVVTNAWGSCCSPAAVVSTLFPLIVGQPADQTVPIGCPAVFSPLVWGFPPLSCQWYINNNLLPGATNTALCLNPALTNEIGSYQLVVTNAYGSATSRLAALNVLVEPNVCALSKYGGGNCTVYLGSYPNSTNRLWATTNLALPPAQWQLVATNLADSNGLAQFLDTNAAGIPAKFYRLSSP